MTNDDGFLKQYESCENVKVKSFWRQKFHSQKVNPKKRSLYCIGSQFGQNSHFLKVDLGKKILYCFGDQNGQSAPASPEQILR